MNYTANPSRLENEQEAAVAVLFGCLQHSGRPVGAGRVEHLSRMLLLSQKFTGFDLQPLAEKVIPLIKSFGSRTVIEHAAPLVTEGFRETLFAMVAEIMTAEGELTDVESEVVGLTALYLGVSIELMRVMLTTFIMRNRWNVR